MSTYGQPDKVQVFVSHEKTYGPGSATLALGKRFLNASERVRARKALRGARHAAHPTREDTNNFTRKKKPNFTRKTNPKRPALFVIEYTNTCAILEADASHLPCGHEQHVTPGYSAPDSHTGIAFDRLQHAENIHMLGSEGKQTQVSSGHTDNEWQWVRREASSSAAHMQIQTDNESSEDQSGSDVESNTQAPGLSRDLSVQSDWEMVSPRPDSDQKKKSWVSMLKRAPVGATRRASHLTEPKWAADAKEGNIPIIQASPWVLSEEMASEYEQSKQGRHYEVNFARTSKESWRQASRKRGRK